MDAFTSRTLPRDPRLWQILSLSILLGWGVCRLGFQVSPAQIAATLLTALVTQWVCDMRFRAGAVILGHWRLPFEPRSALISALSLLLLLRVSHWAWAALAAAIAVTSKSLLRRRGKHIWNPTCFAIVVMLAAPLALRTSPPAWVSAGQWGNAPVLFFAFACLGTLVVTRAARSDVTFAFLGAWAAILFARAAWLGQPSATPLHQLSSGGLELFAFFMISDPRTTPDSRAGRIVFASAVAFGAAFVQFGLWRPNGLLWSLALAAPLVPLLDRLLPGTRHTWNPAAAMDAPGAPIHGGSHASAPACRPAHPAGHTRFARS